MLRLTPIDAIKRQDGLCRVGGGPDYEMARRAPEITLA